MRRLVQTHALGQIKTTIRYICTKFAIFFLPKTASDFVYHQMYALDIVSHMTKVYNKHVAIVVEVKKKFRTLRQYNTQYAEG